MIFDRFSGSGTLACDELDLKIIAARLARLINGLNRIAPETFPQDWYDTYWYAKNGGRIPQQLFDLSDPANARIVAELGQTDPEKHVQISTASTIGLITPGDTPFQIDGKIGGFTGTNSRLVLIIDPLRHLLPRDRDYLVLNERQIREIVIHIADSLDFSRSFYFATSAHPNPQVDLPPLGDIVARRKARGPRWKGLLGWFTYLDTSIWEVDIDESALPPGVLVEPALNGVTIQLGDDHANVPELLIAQTRRAIGWEYRRDVLPT